MADGATVTIVTFFRHFVFLPSPEGVKLVPTKAIQRISVASEREDSVSSRYISRMILVCKGTKSEQYTTALENLFPGSS